jgi:hypothetical protein
MMSDGVGMNVVSATFCFVIFKVAGRGMSGRLADKMKDLNCNWELSAATRFC